MTFPFFLHTSVFLEDFITAFYLILFYLSLPKEREIELFISISWSQQFPYSYSLYTWEETNHLFTI